jgi:hypothetical protein
MADDLTKLAAEFALASRDLRDAFLASPEPKRRGLIAGAFGQRGFFSAVAGEWQSRARIAALPYRAALDEADPERLASDEERIAFWLNTYNALASLSLLEFGVRDRLERQADFFYRTAAIIGGCRFGLEDIEQGILGGNRPSPSWPFRPFGRRDRRAAFAPRKPDFRFHFALDRCVASSPVFRVYAPASLDADLAEAESDYAARFFRPDAASKTIVCSRLYKRARRDLPGRWLDDAAYSRWRVRLLPYDGHVVPSRR